MTRPPVTTVVDAVAADLRRRILTGDPPPGSRLREVDLAEHYDVARHTLRAALRVLAAERLVTVEPHRGARVTLLGTDEIRALMELRAALEVEAARILLERRGDAAWPAEVEQAAAELERACADPDPDPDRTRIDEAHTALHHALVAAAGSGRITAAHAALGAESRVVLLQSRAALPVTRMAQAHRDLLERLRTEGPDALRTHLHEGARAAQPPADSPA